MTRDTEKCPLFVLPCKRLKLEKIWQLFVGTNETVRNIQVSLLSECPSSGNPLYDISSITWQSLQ